MNKIHKLDRLIQNINKAGQIQFQIDKGAKNIYKQLNNRLLVAEYRESGKIPDNFRHKLQYKIQIDNVIIFYRSVIIENETDVKIFKNLCYQEILTYIFLTRLPIWKESIELITHKQH